MIAVFSARDGMLTCGEKQVRLTEQSKICLVWFCRHEGEVISREALTQACWGSRGLIVSEAAVRKTVSRLRSSLTEAGLYSGTLQTSGSAGYILTPGIIEMQPEPDNEATASEPAEAETAQRQEKPSILKAPATTERVSALHIRKKRISRLILTALLIILSALAGYHLRISQLVTPVTYSVAESVGDRQYYFSEYVPKGNKDVAITRISYWLENQAVPLQQSRFVYVNSILNSYIVAITCNGPESEKTSVCRTLTILGDHHP